MSGNIQLIHHIRSQCIRCHFTIAKAYNKYRISFFLIFFRIFHIFFQKTCQCLRYFPVIPFICSCHIRRFQCQICSHRFSHRLRPIFRFNPDRCDLNLLFFIILLFQNDTWYLHMIRFKPFFLFHRKIRPYLILLHHHFYPSFLKLMLVFPIFSEICIDRFQFMP